jgi:hypothetical protein
MTMPPLLMIAAGRRPRLRDNPKVRPKELALHFGVADLLRRFARPDWRWGHYPAGEHREPRVAAKLKAMGVQRGWPDLMLFSPTGRFHALELKREGESLTEDQNSFAAWCAAAGVPYGVARTLDEALRFLSAWGVLRVGIAPAGRQRAPRPADDPEPVGRFSDLPMLGAMPGADH